MLTTPTTFLAKTKKMNVVILTHSIKPTQILSKTNQEAIPSLDNSAKYLQMRHLQNLMHQIKETLIITIVIVIITFYKSKKKIKEK